MTYFDQLINGLNAYHNVNICHRNISSTNLLLDSHFQLKISDCASFVKEQISKKSRFFYHQYKAPEVIEKQLYSFASDIFSCGVILFELLGGCM